MASPSTRRSHFALAAPLILALIGALGLPFSAQAEVSDDCSAWTLFPDFRCEERTARPEGAFNPVGMPYLFEDPHATTGLNFAYVYHRFPDDLGSLGNLTAFGNGGAAHVLALQIRLAITDRLSLIATKDGLSMLVPGENGVIEEDTGIFDMTMGLKYTLIDSRENNFILAPALRYEIPLGSARQFQGNGDGVIIPSFSFRWGLGRFGLDTANIVGSLGGQLPIDGDRSSESIFYNLHIDYGFDIGKSFVEHIVPFLEVNGMHYTNSGNGTNTVYTRLPAPSDAIPLSAAQGALMTGPFEGFDVANLGSPGIEGQGVVVLGGGIRMPTTWGISFAVMYEGPVSAKKDIHDQRFTFMATWEL